jgi:hypothetical protein
MVAGRFAAPDPDQPVMVMVPPFVAYRNWASTASDAVNSNKAKMPCHILFIADIRFQQNAAIKAETVTGNKQIRQPASLGIL